MLSCQINSAEKGKEMERCPFLRISMAHCISSSKEVIRHYLQIPMTSRNSVMYCTSNHYITCIEKDFISSLKCRRCLFLKRIVLSEWRTIEEDLTPFLLEIPAQCSRAKITTTFPDEDLQNATKYKKKTFLFTSGKSTDPSSPKLALPLNGKEVSLQGDAGLSSSEGVARTNGMS